MQSALDIYLHDGQSNHGTVRKKKRRSAPSTELIGENGRIFERRERTLGVLSSVKSSRVTWGKVPVYFEPYIQQDAKKYIYIDEEASSSKPYGRKPGAHLENNNMSISYPWIWFAWTWRLSAFSRAGVVCL